MEPVNMTALVRCWQVSRQDGKKLSFTDHDQNIEIDDHVYFATNPLQMSALEKSIGLDAVNVELTGNFDHEQILKLDIEQGLFDQAELFCFEYDWQKRSFHAEIFRGRFANYSFSENSFGVEVESPFQKLGLVYGRGFHNSCDAELGDFKCGIDMNSPSRVSSFPILEINEFSITIPNQSSFIKGSFHNGSVEFLVNQDLHSKQSVREDKILGNTRELTFWQRVLPYNSSATSVRVSIGCDKSIECCSSRFNNAINFRGFPNIPNDDWISVKLDS